MINNKAVAIDVQFDIGTATAEVKNACKLLDGLLMISKSTGDAVKRAFVPMLNSLQHIQSGVELIVTELTEAATEVAVVNASANTAQGGWNLLEGITSGYETIVQSIAKIEEIEKINGKIYSAWADVVTAPNLSALMKSMLPKTTETLDAVGDWTKNIFGKSLVKGLAKISPQVGNGASDLLTNIASAFSKFGSMLGGMSVGWGAAIGVAIAAAIALVTLIVQNWDEIKVALGAAAEWFNTNIIQPIVGFFTGLWTSITTIVSNIWNGVVSICSGIAQWVQNNVIQPVLNFLTSPIGLVVLGIAALIAIIVLLVKNWDTVSAAVVNFMDILRNALEKFDAFVQGIFNIDWTKYLGPLGNVLNAFFANVENIEVICFLKLCWSNRVLES